MRDDEFGERRSDALDQSAAEVFLDADDGGRQFLLPGLDCKLPSKALVHLPLALDHKTGSYLHLMERADKGLLVAKTLDGSLKDGIAVLLVLEGDVVNGASDFFHPA